MIKTHLNIFISLFFSSVFLGCGNREPSADYTAPKKLIPANVSIPLDSLLVDGKLIIVTDYSPNNYFIYKGRPMGFQYELLRDFASYLNVDLEVLVEPSITYGIDSVILNKAHIAATGLTITPKRKEKIDFTNPILQTKQVLVQRLPDKNLQLSKKEQRKLLITEVTQLAKKTVHVVAGSAYHERLLNLSQEIGDTIFVESYPGTIEMDSAMTNVENEDFDYVVADEYTAKFFSKYHPNLHISTPISLTQNIGWGIAKNTPELTDTLNAWISKSIKGKRWAVIYDKYFRHNKNVKHYAHSEFNFTTSGKLSEYDAIIQNEASKIGWNWMLLAAQISVESNFNNHAKSWVGAKGLMQIMPSTFKAISPNKNILDPSHNISAGVKYNQQLTKFWIDKVVDSTQAIKFALASYNIGKGHVLDAQRLAKKYNLEPSKWDGNVEIMIKKLSSSQYYQQPEVYYGYCRGQEAYNYVKKIYVLYHDYLNLHESITKNQ